jgi:Kef-type K+ transport system membrane component KefB/predicted transcriptional regulator
MSELLNILLAEANSTGSLTAETNYILLIGTAILAGIIGAKIVQKLRIPQIVGYVAIGMILGPVLNVISQEAVQSFDLVSMVALGIIGFLVGGELKREIFVKFGKQVPIVLLFEGVTAFVLVGVFSFCAMWYFSNWQTALAVGVVFGAICSATDPASTIAVLWEYKARGPLTSMLTAIVTLDDALALVLYAISISVAGVITGHQESGFLTAIFHTAYEVFGALVLGLISGIMLSMVLKRINDSEKILVLVLSVVLLVLGVSISLRLDVILAAMALGVTLVNATPRAAQMALDVLHKFFAPIYILFFVLVGARVSFSHFNKVIGALVIAYVIGSITGKTLGAYLGGLCSGTVKTVKNYLGFCLYPQGGIAVALLIIASQRFDSNISALMLLVVIIGAFILQIVGPIGVKIGAGKACELGLNVTEQDLIKTYKVSNVMNTKVPVINAGMPLSEVVKVLSSSDYSYYSVVDNQQKVIGALTIDGIRNTFATRELNDWLVALDIAEPVAAKVTSDVPLSTAFERMKEYDVEQIPVVVSEQNAESVGILDARAVHRQLTAFVLEKQREADRMFTARPNRLQQTGRVFIQ